MQAVTVGADPEFFVRRNGHWISGHTFKCGTKRIPLKTEHGSVQVDGMALECNVTPADNIVDFVRNSYNVISDLRKIVQEQQKSADIHPAPAVIFGANVFDQTPPEFLALGCRPDWNAYTKRQNVPPTLHTGMRYRTGAGHLHLGWTKGANVRSYKHIDLCCKIVRELDYRIGLPSLLWDRDPLRRRLYGKAGSFRPKPYGLEYRVPSNRLFSDPALVAFAFKHVREAYSDIVENKGLIQDLYKDEAKAWIDGHDLSWRMTYPTLYDRLDPFSLNNKISYQ